MSFDLALSKGDISVGPDGDLRKIRDTSKLVQDVLKILHTPVGSNPFYPQIGSTLTTDNIGNVVSQQFAETKATASIISSIQLMQSIQRNQQIFQVVTPGEQIIGISQVDVEQDPQDPRQYNIKITVITGAQTVLQLPSFSISTTLDQ